MAITITQEITLDVVKYNTYTTLIAKQYDKSSRFLKVTIQQNGVTLDVSDASSATISFRLPDENTIMFLGTVNSDGTVTVPLPKDALMLDGTVRASVGVLGSDSELKTLNFAIEVQKAETGEDSDITEDENYSVLLGLISSVQTAVTAAETATEEATAAAEAANTATENIGTAITDAETATEKANEATSSANTAANLANTAASAANEAASLANTAASNADTATETANTAAEALIIEDEDGTKYTYKFYVEDGYLGITLTEVASE